MTIFKHVVVDLFILTVLVAIWVLWAREWLRLKPWGWSQAFFAFIEPVEILLWDKSETILWSRFLQLLGVALVFLSWLGALDVTPFVMLVPPEYQIWLSAAPFVAVTLAGIVTEILRRYTTKPLEIVAVPLNAKPEVAAVVEAANAAKAAAVAVITVPIIPPRVAETVIDNADVVKGAAAGIESIAKAA